MSSYYRKQTTYRHDYNKGKAPDHDSYDMRRSWDHSKPSLDDPIWQRGRNESSEQYEERLREMRAHQREPDYYRTYEERKAHDHYGHPHDNPGHHHDHLEQRRDHDRDRDGPYTDRPSYDDKVWQRGRNESSEQYEDRMREMREMRNGPMTDRGHHEYQQRQHRNDPYDRYRPTQKDYGDFVQKHEPRIGDMPRPYRGQFERQVRELNLNQDQAAHPIPPPHIDFKSTGPIDNVSKPESGVYLFIRTHKDALSDVRTSFQRHKSTLNQEGHLTGIAFPEHIKVTGEPSNWRLRPGPWRQDDRPESKEYYTDYIIIVLWFASAQRAQWWIDYDPGFKIAAFPEPYGADMAIVPINYIPPEDALCTTFLLTEYPEVRRPDYFRNEIIEPMKHILREYETCEPFVVRTNAVKPVRGTWLGHRSTVAVHRFPTDDEARRFYNDRRAATLRGKLNGVTRGGRHTTVRFTVTPMW